MNRFKVGDKVILYKMCSDHHVYEITHIYPDQVCNIEVVLLKDENGIEFPTPISVENLRKFKE